VPLGTVVKTKKLETLFEITEDGRNKCLEVVKEGLGNWHFRSATNKLQDMLNLVYQDQRWM
jgi:GTPase involved in cell partitioning and DNA repair